MKEYMTKTRRIMAAVKGETVDRVPLSFFQHNLETEHSPDATVAYLLEQNRKFGWDFIKVQLNYTYYGQAWGCKYRITPGQKPVQEYYVLKSAKDLNKLKKLDGTKGVFADQLKVTRMLGESLKGSVPYIQTLFSPLSVLIQLSGGVPLSPSETDAVRQFMREDPKAMHYALSVISQTLADYARESIKLGASGIFVTTTSWSGEVMTEEDYKVFGKPYDIAIFEAANQAGATINILHLCRDKIFFDLINEYPVQILSYDSHTKNNPSLKEAMLRTSKALWGGINQKMMPQGPKEEIIAEVRAALEQTGRKRFILGPGCSLPTGVTIPDAHLIAAKEALEE